MKNLYLFLMLVCVCLCSCERYDTLVNKDEECNRTWADVEAQLQRRSDLVPNLVSIVKGSAAHEHKVLTEVITARASATQIKLSAEDLTDPDKVAAFEKAQNQLKGSLSRLMMLQESYPDLKANSAFHDLQVQIEGTENRILRSREKYNEAVGEYNKELKRISGTVVNKITGKPFKERAYFHASPEAQAVPTVNFDSSSKP